jgi:hypothetical protein
MDRVIIKAGCQNLLRAVLNRLIRNAVYLNSGYYLINFFVAVNSEYQLYGSSSPQNPQSGKAVIYVPYIGRVSSRANDSE